MALTDDKRVKPPLLSQATDRERGGWLASIAPGFRKLISKRETPDNLWVKCPDTGEMIYRPDLEAALWVTPHGRHMRIGPALRFQFTFDHAKYDAIALPAIPDDPLEFTYNKNYKDALAAARKSTNQSDAMACAVGEIRGQPAVVLVQDFGFMGGSLGIAVGEGFIAGVDEAVKRDAPLVIFVSSGGARMQEGALSLMQMARATLAIQRLRKAKLPYIVVLTDPTFGGVTASYAMLGDIHLAEPGAQIGFSGRRVIKDTIRETLPPEYQTSEFLMDRGMVDKVTPRAELPRVLGSILRTLLMARSRVSASGF